MKQLNQKYIYQLTQTKVFIKESDMITAVLTHWRLQEFIELITIKREGEQEHISEKLNSK